GGSATDCTVSGRSGRRNTRYSARLAGFSLAASRRRHEKGHRAGDAVAPRGGAWSDAGAGARVVAVPQRLSAGDERAGDAVPHGARAPESRLGRRRPNALAPLPLPAPISFSRREAYACEPGRNPSLTWTNWRAPAARVAAAPTTQTTRPARPTTS